MARLSTDEPKVITANRLTDGAVVWLTQGDAWGTDLVRARVLTDADGVAAALVTARAAAARQEVVEPYAVDVAIETTGPRPLKMRERVRADGPTVQVGPQQVLEVA